MEVLKKKRKAIRSQVTRLVNDAEGLLRAPGPNAAELEMLIERLTLAQGQLNNVDSAIEPLVSEQDGDAEFA